MEVGPLLHNDIWPVPIFWPKDVDFMPFTCQPGGELVISSFNPTIDVGEYGIVYKSYAHILFETGTCPIIIIRESRCLSPNFHDLVRYLHDLISKQLRVVPY